MSEPQIPQKGPFVLEVEAGKYAWCVCGKSLKQPYCDGSHRDTEFTPLIVEIKEKTTVAWCGCKHTYSKPYCDGSHNQL